MKKNNSVLIEDKNVAYMTHKEKIVKFRVINLLRKTHHAKYAERLKKFYVKIIPLKADPGCTAFISFDEGYIGIGEGFLNDPNTFNQLNVIIRHELSHALMMHQIRMMHKMGDELADNYGYSHSMHELLNVIMDFEISNKRYTEADKNTMRHLMLNGEEIVALVTEDHREKWLNLTVEEMYDEITKEIEKLNAQLLANNNQFIKDETDGFMQDIDYKVLRPYSASGITANDPSRLTGSVQEIIDGEAVIIGSPDAFTQFKFGDYHINFENAPDALKKILINVNKIITNPDSVYNENYSDVATEAKAIIDEIRKTSAMKPYVFKQKLADGSNGPEKNVLIVSPEEKWVLIEILKYIAGDRSKNQNDFHNGVPTVHVKGIDKSPEYIAMFNKIIDAFNNGDITIDDLNNFLNQGAAE